MHIYLLTRGIKQQRDIWLNFMQSQFYPWKRKNLKTNKEETTFVQGGLRPLELWEYVVPEESMSEVLTCLGIQQENAKGRDWKDNLLFKFLRKVFRADPLPEDWKPDKTIPRVMRVDGLGIQIIGIKKDIRHKWEEVGYEQEML